MNEHRWWMAPDGRYIVRNDDCPQCWGGVYGREVLPVVVGSKAWAAIQAMQFVKVGRKDGVAAWRASDIIGLPQDMYLDGWTLLPTGPKRGDRVLGVDCQGNEWTGPYWGAAKNGEGHWLGAGPIVWVERVEAL